MLAIALVGCLFFQEPAPKPAGGQDKQAKSSQSSSTKKLETWDDRKARSMAKVFEKATKPKKVSMKVRKDALDELVGGKSLHLIKPLQKFIEKDSSIVLKKQAVDMLGDQPEKRAKAAILKLMKNARVSANPQVQARLVHSLSRAGYDEKDWGEIDEVLEDDYDTERVPVHEAILDLVAKHKEVQAIPMLLRNIDEPGPTNVEVADNPPAEYWKARWHSWAVWKAKVKEALFQITGQRFSTAKEASIWIQRNKDKIGKKSKKKGKR